MPVSPRARAKSSKSARARSGSSALSKLGRRPRAIEHREDRAADVLHVAIHLSRVVAEDAQLADLFRSVAHRLLGIALLHRREDDHAGADLRDQHVPDGHRRAAHALDHAFHRSGISCSSSSIATATSPS
jgi:hypothetical protein